MKIKCLNCIHYSTCALRMSGLDIKTLNENCKDYIEDKTKDIEITMPNIKCYNCIHNRICFNLIGGMNLQMKAENCNDYLGIKDVWISPVKFGDTVYIIENGSIYSACAGYIEGFLTSNGVKWTIHYSYSNDTWGEPEVYSWSGTYGHRVFKTEKDAVNYLEKNKKGSQ